MSRSQQVKHLGLRRGARALAEFIFGDEGEFKKVYPLKTQLGLFKMKGLLCGREATIADRIAEHEGRAGKSET